MDILQITAPVPTKTPVSDKAEGAVPVQEGQSSPAAFAQLLQGMKNTAGEDVGAQEADVLMQLAMSGLSESELELSTSMDGIAALGVEGLLGQAQRLESVELHALDQAHRVGDAEFLLAAQTQRMDAESEGEQGVLPGNAFLAAPEFGAQPQVAVGHSVATVAAGVQTASSLFANRAMQTAMAAASAVVAEATPAADVVEHIFAGAVDLDRGVDEGRLVLQGAWKLDESAQTHPVLQRLMGQVEHWAAATAGLQPKSTGDRLDAKGAAAQAAESLLVGAGSGTRLTEDAVKETQAAQDAVLDAEAGAPVEDMRFWLQGKLQRAEVVLEKDGQPVRVQVSVRGNEAQVSFQSDQAQTRELLDQSVAQLRTMLEAQGLQLASVSVQAEAQGQTSEGDARNPWGNGVARQAQVEVPVQESAAVPRPRSQGIDFYA